MLLSQKLRQELVYVAKNTEQREYFSILPAYMEGSCQTGVVYYAKYSLNKNYLGA